MRPHARPLALVATLLIGGVAVIGGALVLAGGSPEAGRTALEMTDPDAADGAAEPAPAEELSTGQPAPDVGDAAAVDTVDPTDAADDPTRSPVVETSPQPEPAPERELPPGPPSDERTLEVTATVGGDIAPKSVVYAPGGLFLAQNMMYRHTVTVYDRDRVLVATIADTVNPAAFGLPGPDADLRGAPVEAAITPDGAHAYVSNYRMSGEGYDNGGTDICGPEDGYDDSLLYRIDLGTFEIDQVIGVGSVPKYVAVTPDGATVLVTNWCSYDLSLIDVATATEVARIDLGRYPRGIAVTPDSGTAYIALMGAFDILVLDLELLLDATGPDAAGDGLDDDVLSAAIDRLVGVGRSPRHLVLSPGGDVLYATINGDGVTARIDLVSGEVVTVATGRAPRSMDIAADGRSLYVVNHLDDTVSKVRTADMQVLQTIEVDPRPIGVAYDDATGEVWVASYSGSLTVLSDR